MQEVILGVWATGFWEWLGGRLQSNPKPGLTHI